MGLPFNGDLVPVSSGFANLGVEVGTNGENSFDIASIAPFNHIHQNSGVYHDPLYGQSGVLRYSYQADAFQVSTDGGLTFLNLSAGAGVDSVGVLGDTNLTGNIDLATPTSGFMTITDSTDASPLLFAVDQLGLSGLWDFPTQGFNGRVVNSLTDDNGTESQGTINVTGASGIIVDIVGQTMTIATNTDTSTVARCYSQTFAPSFSWTITHNLDTEDVQVFLLDDSAPREYILADSIEITDSNTVTVGWNTSQGGRAIIQGC